MPLVLRAALLAGLAILILLAVRKPLRRYSVAMVIGDANSSSVAFQVNADGFEGDGKHSIPRVLTPAGEKFSVSTGEWRLDMIVRPTDTPDKVWLTGKLFKGAALVTAPTLLARVRVGEGDKAFSMAMTVTPQP
ncbi:hypothetical protein MasN3_46720 [Massilia varians]|uniref:Uncharacterized protein n=2 Tax=Massilia varians TaxID=457921 RepID=A0ABM8CD12_9BURK|nr:hypothetical protein MasN3_46720 [Massilia varians]